MPQEAVDASDDDDDDDEMLMAVAVAQSIADMETQPAATGNKEVKAKKDKRTDFDIREKLMELERKLVDTCKQEHYFPDEVQKIIKEMDKLRKKLNKLENPAAASSSAAIEICRPAGLVVVAPALSASFVAPRLWSLPDVPRF